MLKKLVIISALFISSLSHLYAGFYVGPSLNFEAYNASNIRYEGLRPMLTAGYGTNFRNLLYISIEAFGGPKSITINNVPRNGNSLKTKWSYGGSLLPAYIIDQDLLLYLRLGLVSTNFEKLNTIKSGREIGIGLQAQVLECWSVRGEYDYLQYSSLSEIGQLRADEFNVAIIYQF
jgi:opacity protein-like surface antigen